MISLPNPKIYVLLGELHSLFPLNIIRGVLANSPPSRSHAHPLLCYGIP